MTDYHRRPLKAAEFRAAVSRLQEVHPLSIITSTHRSASHNASVGGGLTSKHLLYPLTPVACDLDWPTWDAITEGSVLAQSLEHDAKVLGLWARYHDAHLHLQGLAPGPIPQGYDPV